VGIWKLLQHAPEDAGLASRCLSHQDCLKPDPSRAFDSIRINILNIAVVGIELVMGTIGEIAQVSLMDADPSPSDKLGVAHADQPHVSLVMPYGSLLTIVRVRRGLYRAASVTDIAATSVMRPAP